MMNADDLKHEVLFNVERYSALLNTPNLAELNIANLNTLIFNELTRLIPTGRGTTSYIGQAVDRLASVATATGISGSTTMQVADGKIKF